MASDLQERTARTVALIVAVFGIPPAIGLALATLRVTDGDAVALALGVGIFAGIVVAGFVLLLAASGTPDPTFGQDE